MGGRHGPWPSVQSTLPILTKLQHPTPGVPIGKVLSSPCLGRLRWRRPCPPDMDTLSQATLHIPLGLTCCSVPRQLHMPLLTWYVPCSVPPNGFRIELFRKKKGRVITSHSLAQNPPIAFSSFPEQNPNAFPWSIGPINLSPTSLHHLIQSMFADKNSFVGHLRGSFS